MKLRNLFFFTILLLSFVVSSCDADLLFEPANDPELSNQVVTKPEGPYGIRDCGSEEVMDRLMQNPTYAAAFREKLRSLELASGTRADCSSPVQIPVAIHFQGISNANRACLETMAIEQIEALNADYKALNADISKWNNQAAAYFPGVNFGSTCLEFSIASQNHPAGTGLANGSLAVTINQVSGDFDSDWSGYLNIFIIKNTGFLGYAPLGGDGNGDGVVVDASAFGLGRTCSGIGAEAPFDKGRTLTHEVGHYLFLDHIWGDGCNVDDGINDTPQQGDANYGCPDLGISSCGSTDMHMNYMDYTDDACMYMFSNGQAVRMENYIRNNLGRITSNAANVLGGITPQPPTCTDGIKNGDETGVDCGGSCAPCEVAEVCGSPTSFSVQSISATSFEISWPAGGDAEKFRFRYKTGNQTWKTINLTTASVILENLVAGSTYTYQVRTYCTSGGWQNWSVNGSLTVAEDGGGDDGACQENKITMKLVLDDFGSETSWEIRDANNLKIAAGGPYEDFTAGKIITETFCLPDACYKFILKDSFGDGICCNYGEGKLTLFDSSGEEIARSNGRFGSRQRINFCAGSAARMQNALIESDEQAPVSTSKLQVLRSRN
jgi:chitodextrinase